MGKNSARLRLSFLILILIIFLVLLIDQSVGFGAGNIPSYAFLENKAFRHGDIEDVLSELAKKAAGGVLGVMGTRKFGGLDIKRVYFGNWLRDYSQAMDVAGLSKLPKQTILNLVMALGFLAHGYATDEFEVTEERLGVYLPVEHIDNPKGYNDGNDARAVHPGLRGPIDPQELQIDPRTGMKNYIANENGTWDTSAACIRRTLLKCIELGRKAKNGDSADYYEAYRLLGSALHTLEDLTAHSNWCELSLRRLGHSNVFCHVGDGCQIDTPSGQAPPLVTGVFGAADFLHSLLGEATDHISEASVSDLNQAMTKARGAPGSDPSGNALRSLLFEMPNKGNNELSREFDGLSEIRSRAAPGSGFDPSQMSPQELHSTLWKVLKFRDNVCKSVERTIEKIPGLSTLSEKISNAVNRFVFTTLEPYLKPIMQSATGTLQSGSAAVINKQEQYEVFDNPYADDPTHSLLSKDHFGLILNEPAGNLAKIVVKHSVKAVVQAWGSTSIDAFQTINKILEAFHHPYFVDGSSDVQREMGEYMRDWIGKMSAQDREYVLNALMKDSVRNGRNNRRGHSHNYQQGSCGSHGSNTFGSHMQGIMPNSQSIMGKLSNQIPGYAQMQGLSSGIGRDMNVNSIPNQSSSVPHPLSNLSSTNPSNYRPPTAQEYTTSPSGEAQRFSMPEAGYPQSPADYGPGPGGFSIPEPRTNDFDGQSRPPTISFPRVSNEPPPPPTRAETYGESTDYSNEYNNPTIFPGPLNTNLPPGSNMGQWSSYNQNQSSYHPFEQAPNYPPPPTWGLPNQQQPAFPTQDGWSQSSHQHPPPPPPGGYPSSTYRPNGWG